MSTRGTKARGHEGTEAKSKATADAAVAQPKYTPPARRSALTVEASAPSDPPDVTDVQGKVLLGKKSVESGSSGAASTGPVPLVMPKKRQLFLPYGQRWINDQSKRKFYRKSRRIGITWYESYDSVAPRMTFKRPWDYYYTAVNLDGAREFIDYGEFFARNVFGKTAETYDDQIEFEYRDAEGRDKKLSVNTLSIRFPNETKLVAMPSRPAALRGRSGDLGADEIDFHEDAEGLYRAAASVTKWGGTFRGWSSANGEGTLGEKIVGVCCKVLRALGHDPLNMPGGGVPFDVLTAKARELRLRPVMSFHRTTITQAVEQGLVELLNTVTGTEYTRESFLQECIDECLNEDHYNQEYGCLATTALNAALKYHIVEAVMHEACGGMVDWPEPLDNVLVGYQGGKLYIGVDVARTANWTVIWIFEAVGDVLWTRGIYRMKNVSMVDQQRVLETIAGKGQLARCSILKRGVGIGITDWMIRKFGEARVSGLDETNTNKVGMIIGAVQKFEDRLVRVPMNHDLKEKLHSVRETRTPGGQVTYTAPTFEDGSHGDEAMACFAAIDAAAAGGGAIDGPIGLKIATPSRPLEGW